jgi:hypothetical protein
MPWITSVDAPDLSSLPAPILSEYGLRILLADKALKDSKLRAYVTNLIHTTDKAIREYNAGRETLVIYAASANRTRLLIEGLGRFENCVNSAKRALLFVQRLAGHKGGPKPDKAVRGEAQRFEKTITDIRDCIEHIEKDLAHSLPEGIAQILSVDRSGTRLELAGHHLKFSELAGLLCKLHSLATECARFTDATPSAGAAKAKGKK